MRNIEFSEMTNRLHRNLVGAAFLIVCIKGFNLQIGEASPSFLKVSNLTTDVALWILLFVVLYHAVAFSLRAFEEYRLWELDLAGKEANLWSGGTGFILLADQLKHVAGILEKITDNSGAIAHQNQDILTDADAKKLKTLSTNVETYAKRFDNFPRITRVRFWAWDIGMAAFVTLVALVFFFSG